MSKPTIEAKEKHLLKVEAEDAIAAVEWMYIFSQLCGRARKARGDKEERAIIGMLRAVDRTELLNARLRLMQIPETRLEFGRDNVKAAKDS